MNFRGSVRQVDVFTGSGAYQVILSTTGGGELVATTDDARAQALLLASLATSKTVVVEYTAGTPNKLTRVTLSS
jgi:hypothetical protein